ncbi:hypothetical protein A0H81_12420 [Grifola frondosa]|uniref:Uncharacterized protein n=1 Tax=Grifola frondosa TaxID=5627 RepID=A0A1C7LV12_GRIFR|nr:hypothetical protein A0H81_12420 [Grifola frondosa]
MVSAHRLLARYDISQEQRAASREQQSPLHIRSSYPETFNVLPKVLQQVRCRRRLSSALHVGTFPSHSFIMQWSAASA